MKEQKQSKRFDLSQLLKNSILSITLILLLIFSYGSYRAYSFAKNLYSELTKEPVIIQNKINENKDYYIFIRRLEVAHLNQENESWDQHPSPSHPDLFYTLNWQGNSVFESPIRKDSLIGRWQGFELNYLQQIKDMSVNVGSLMAAALIHPASGNEIKIQIHDDDSIKNDTIAELKIFLGDLNIGSNDISCDNFRLLKSLQLMVIPADEASTFLMQYYKKALLSK